MWVERCADDANVQRKIFRCLPEEGMCKCAVEKKILLNQMYNMN